VFLGATIPVVLLVVCCGGFGALTSFVPNNAKCPVCGAEFHVADDVPAALDAHSYTCPGCGRTVDAATLRIIYDGAHAKKAGTTSP
jgi:hypothetical protein